LPSRFFGHAEYGRTEDFLRLRILRTRFLAGWVLVFTTVPPQVIGTQTVIAL
jgi:hypothetical protein